MPQSDLDPDGDGEADDVKDMKEVPDPTQDIIYNQSGEATLSFYVFENLREPGTRNTLPNIPIRQVRFRRLISATSLCWRETRIPAR